MLFKRLTEIVLCVLGLILIIQGIDIIFNFGVSLYLFYAFWLVVCFMLGAGFCRYNISDTLCNSEDVKEDSD